MVEDQPVSARLTSAIDVAVGSRLCVQNHRFDVRVNTPMGHTPRLRVSRYYWELEPPVAVDFVRDLRHGELEVAAKKQYLKDQNIRYCLVRDVFDGEGVGAALAALAEAEVQAEPDTDTKTKAKAKKPVTGPRRRRQ